MKIRRDFRRSFISTRVKNDLWHHSSETGKSFRGTYFSSPDTTNLKTIKLSRPTSLDLNRLEQKVCKRTHNSKTGVSQRRTGTKVSKSWVRNRRPKTVVVLFMTSFPSPPTFSCSLFLLTLFIVGLFSIFCISPLTFHLSRQLSLYIITLNFWDNFCSLNDNTNKWHGSYYR